MSNFIRKYVKGDQTIWVIIIFLALVSLLTVYSSTGSLAYKTQGGNTTYFMFKQLAFLMVGMTLIVVVHHIPYKYFIIFSLPALYFSILMLGVTLMSGQNLNEASRWLTVPGIGLSFQPSEMAKLALIVYVARVLAQHQREGEPTYGAFGPIMIHTGIVCLLIFPENLSTSVLLGGVVMLMMYLGRVPFKNLFFTGFGGIALVTLVLVLAMNDIVLIDRAETWAARVERFMDDDAEVNEYGSDYQVTQSKIAIATGGILGKGPGNSDQRNFLPHPYSDFIYAIIAEEFGLLGAILVLAAYFFFLGRIGVLVRSSNRTFPAFMVLGLGLMLVIQAFVNMGVAVGIFPVTGQPLPLVSMGGTSILFTCLALGAILSVSRHNQIEKKKQMEKESAQAEAT
ncbi:FtsW/RodA/SpoVE family cell cycle protein [Marinilabilia rubra]|uniref:Probable peptidoglycan glycosyltransferase FtsW n=1 Tax=Marinilabilia rubra TaxID=2162893 RepID=A0A2U2BEB1_9BACT|nr:FtsW/RodA/SpoVE family cell cycle protein [Marinilabilia rubra]PWE01410.1 rod shape-determining protein RodA [Marinilabilia rubra]